MWRVMPSNNLFALAIAYVPYLGKGDSENRTLAHERLMAQMRLDGLEFSDRIHAAEIAVEIARLDRELDDFAAELNELACNQNLKTIWRGVYEPRR